MSENKPDLPHPIQPMALDERGTLRFKANPIVRDMLDFATPLGFDMNRIAVTSAYSRDDRVQFAQLIGYSHDGSSTLSYMTDEVWEAAQAMYEQGISEDQARVQVLREKLRHVRKIFGKACDEVFNLGENPGEDIDNA